MDLDDDTLDALAERLALKMRPSTPPAPPAPPRAPKPEDADSYVGDGVLQPHKLPAKITFPEAHWGHLSIQGGVDLLHRNPDPHFTGKTLAVSHNTTGHHNREYVVSAHDMRQHALASAAGGGKGKKTGRPDAVVLHPKKFGPTPEDGAVKAVAADLGLFPDYEEGFRLHDGKRGGAPEEVAAVYESMRTYMDRDMHTASSNTGTRVTTVLAYRDRKLCGVAYTFDFPVISTRSDRGLGQRRSVRFTIPRCSKTGRTDVVAAVTAVVTGDPRDRSKGIRHLYLGDGVAEVCEVYVVRTPGAGTDSAVQVLVLGNEDAVIDVLTAGTKDRPRYMNTSSYMCLAPDAELLYRELAPYLGHSVFLSGFGAFSQGAALLYDQERGIHVAPKPGERASETLLRSAEADSGYNQLRAFLAHFVHHGESAHTSLVLFVDDSFWMAALGGAVVTEGSLCVPEPLLLLFLLRHVAGRGVQVVDVSRFGHGNIGRASMHVALHADSWAFVWLAYELHATRGAMALVPDSAMLNCDHGQHEALGTLPLQAVLRQYVHDSEADYDNPSRDARLSQNRYRAAMRPRVFHKYLMHAARAGGYLRFPRSGLWGSAHLDRTVSRNPRETIEKRMAFFDCIGLTEATLAILQNAPPMVLEDQEYTLRFCAAANLLLARFLLDRQAGVWPDKKRGKVEPKNKGNGKPLSNTYVCSSSLDVEPYRQDLRDAVDSALSYAPEQAKRWMKQFRRFLSHRVEHGLATTKDLVGLSYVRDERNKYGIGATFMVAPDCTEDVELALNLQGAVKLPSTGVFSFITFNGLLHEMLLARSLLPQSYALLMSHTPDATTLSNYCVAVLDGANTPAYMPAWYNLAPDGSAGTGSLFRLAQPSPEALKAHPDAHGGKRLVWMDETVPWWAMAEWALGYRTELQGIPLSDFWDAFPQDSSARSPIHVAYRIACEALDGRERSDQESPLKVEAHTAMMMVENFTWGKVPAVLMLTPLTVTMKGNAMSY